MSRKCDNCGRVEYRAEIKMHNGLLNGKKALICETCALACILKTKLIERRIDPDSLVPVGVPTEEQDGIEQTPVTFTYKRR
jgi:hypothetical protein